jgi:hypothetical protein
MTELQILLRSAANEIRDLRRRNELLNAKVEMIDLFACVLQTQAASRSVGASPDVAWALDKKVDELQQEEDRRPRPVPVRGE